MPDVDADDLGGDFDAVLRRVLSGERLRVTVSGRPVADLVPVPKRPRSMSWHSFMTRNDTWRADPGLTAELAELLREPASGDASSTSAGFPSSSVIYAGATRYVGDHW
ncbi:MAG: type II toxin-antitoxin system Phd/YefM family antitoxin [Acidimicrobiales bacterium]